MGIVLELRRVPADELRDLIDDPSDIYWVLFGVEGPQASAGCLGGLFGIFGSAQAESERPPWREPAPEMVANLDKLWDCTHYLLTVDQVEGALPASYLLEGGATLGDVDVGYGPARALSPDETRDFAAFVSKLTRSDIEERFDPAALAAAEVYPEIWDRGDDELPYVWETFEHLQRFLSAAASEGEGIIIFHA